MRKIILFCLVAAVVAEAQTNKTTEVLNGCTIERYTLFSPSMNRDIKVAVVLPPDYVTFPDKSFPVLHTLHGWLAPYDTFANMNLLRLELASKPMIVTCFDGDLDLNGDGTEDMGSWYIDAPELPMSQYETFFFDEFIPFLNQEYRTDPLRQGVTGFSMGGAGSFGYMLSHPDYFKSISSLSGAFYHFTSSLGLQTLLGSYSLYPERYSAIDPFVGVAQATNLPPIYLDCGTADSLIGSNREMHQALLNKGFDVEYKETIGAAHNWTFWLAASPAVVEFHWKNGLALIAADFEIDTLSGTAPVSVGFSDYSSGIITNRFWDFGDGTVTNTTETNVTHIYTTAGIYTIQLVVSGPDGMDSSTQGNAVTVAPASGGTAYYAEGNPADNSVGLNVSGVPTPLSDVTKVNLVAGDDAPNYNQSNGCAVVVFALPGLNGEPIASAHLDFSWRLANEAVASLPVSLDLYGIRRSSVSTVVAGDYGFMAVKNPTDTLIQSAVVTKTATNADPLAPAETSVTGDMALAAWLTAQYAAGAKAGDYVFLRFHPSGSTMNKWEIGSGNQTDVSLRPLLTITAGELAANPDADNDGLPNDWEVLYFGGATNANPSALAANGINTIREAYIAGLNPTNAQSLFSVSNGWNTLHWDAVSGRVYSVWGTTNLPDGFQPLETNILWPQNSWTGQVGGAQGGTFYQLGVQLAL